MAQDRKVGQHPVTLVDSEGNLIDATFPLPVSLSTADIEIGAVEIKNATTDTRVNVSTVGATNILHAGIFNSSGAQIDTFPISGTVTVTATDLDIRDLTSASDSVAVTTVKPDGTNTMPSLDVVNRAGFVKLTNGTVSADITNDGTYEALNVWDSIAFDTLNSVIATDGTAAFAPIKILKVGGQSADDAGMQLLYLSGSGHNLVDLHAADGTALTETGGKLDVTAVQSGTWNIGTLTGITNDVSIDDGGNSITVDGAQNTEYTEGDTDATITGIAAMAEAASNTLQPLQLDSNNNLKVVGGASIVNAIDSTTYDLQSAAFSGTSSVPDDYILDSIEFNFSSNESRTVTLTTADGTIVWSDTNTNDDIVLENIDMGFNGGENFTIDVTQTSGACNMDVIAKVKQGTTFVAGSTVAATQSGAWNVGVNAGTNIMGKASLVDSGGTDITTVTDEGDTSISVTPGSNEVFTIHLFADDISATTGLMAIDLSDTTNWPHSNTGHIDIVWTEIDINGSKLFQGDIQLGFLSDVDATNGDLNIIKGWHFGQVGTNESVNIVEHSDFAWHPIELTTTGWFGPTNADDTLFQTDVNLQGPDNAVSYPSGNGDFVLKIIRDAGNVDVGLTVGYIVRS